jgi:hypothetical protein
MKWIADTINNSTKNAGTSTVFSWFHRALGMVYLIAFIPLFWEIGPLIGENGLQPATNLLSKTYSINGYFASILQFPSLFHLYPCNTTLYLIITLGCIAGLSMLFNYRIFISGLLAWGCFLSITSIGGDFFIIIIDLFLAEVGFLSLFSTYCLQYKNYIPNIIWWVFKWLNFKLWFSMGVIKFYNPEATWTSFTFFDTFFQAQPMPTPLAKIFHQCPQLLKKTAIVCLFIGEMVIPFFIFGKKPLRWIGVLTFVIISILIQLNGNYGYFNVLSIVIAITILKDTDLGLNDVDALSPQSLKLLKISLFSNLTIQFIYILLLFHPKPFSYQNHFNFIHTYFKSNTIITYPFKLISYWRLCNPYGVFKSIPSYHGELRISGSADGNEWKIYEFKYLPSGHTDYLGFYAPYYPRLDHLMFYETLSERNAKYNTLNLFYKEDIPWSSQFIKQIIKNNESSTSLLKNNPFKNQQGPKYIKLETYRLSFNENTDKNWTATKMPFERVLTIESDFTVAILPYDSAMKVVSN